MKKAQPSTSKEHQQLQHPTTTRKLKIWELNQPPKLDRVSSEGNLNRMVPWASWHLDLPRVRWFCRDMSHRQIISSKSSPILLRVWSLWEKRLVFPKTSWSNNLILLRAEQATWIRQRHQLKKQLHQIQSSATQENHRCMKSQNHKQQEAVQDSNQLGSHYGPADLLLYNKESSRQIKLRIHV